MAATFLLEFHDISSIFADDFLHVQQWALERDWSPSLVMWTPRWLGAFNESGNRRLCRGISESGAKIVLHGLEHWGRGSTWDRLWYGENVGPELSGMEPGEIKERLIEGRRLLQDWTGEAVDWYCGPRWSINRVTERCLRELGFIGIMKKRTIACFQDGLIRAPSLSFDHGRRWYANRINGWMRRIIVPQIENGESRFRLVIHPGDFANPGIKSELDDVSNRLKEAGCQLQSLKSWLT